MNIKPTPCYNCLILPICKTRASEISLDASEYTVYSQTLKTSIRLKCSLYYDYISPTKNHEMGMYRRRLAVHYLTGVDIGVFQNQPSIKELYDISNMKEEYKP